MSLPPYRFEGSSFGCTAYGGYCFECNVPIGDESFNYRMFKGHCNRKRKIDINHNIGTTSSKKEFVNIVQQKIQNLQGVKLQYVTNEQKEHYCCGICSIYYARLEDAKRHQTDGKCKEGTFSKKYLFKTTCGRFVESPQNDHAEVEPSQEELMQQPPSMSSLSGAISQPPYRFEGSSFGCTAFGGYCFVCQVPIGDESFNYSISDHCSRKLKMNIHHTIGTSSATSKKEFGKLVQQKIQTLQGQKNNYVTNIRKLHYFCSICSKSYTKYDKVKVHQTDGKCKEGTFLKKYLVKTTCGRYVEPPQNNLEQNIPQDQAEIESSIDNLEPNIPEDQSIVSFYSIQNNLEENIPQDQADTEIESSQEERIQILNSKVEVLNANMTELTTTVVDLKQQLLLIGQETKEQKLEIEALKSKNIELMKKLMEQSEIVCQECSTKSNANSTTLNNKRRKQG